MMYSSHGQLEIVLLLVSSVCKMVYEQGTPDVDKIKILRNC